MKELNIIKRGGGLGDCLALWPALYEIRANDPLMKIRLIGRTKYLKLMVGINGADKARERLGRRGGVTIEVPNRGPLHIRKLIHERLPKLVPGYSNCPTADLDLQYTYEYSPKPSKDVVVFADSRSADRRLGFDTWQTIRHFLVDWGYTCIAPLHRSGTLLRQQREVAHYTHVYPKTFHDLALQCLNSRLVIGVDSGPTHFASLIGANTIICYNTDSWKEWPPMGTRSTMVTRSNELDILRAIMQRLKNG